MNVQLDGGRKLRRSLEHNSLPTMQKHPDLTIRRVEQFVEMTLRPLLLGDPADLLVEICEDPHPTQQAAAAGKWKPIKAGASWGPAYRTVWFRASGSIPRSWAGRTVVAILDVGGERTIWKGNQPVWGVDFAHDHYRISRAARGGEKVEVYVEAYGGNPDVRVHGIPPPRQEKPFQVGQVSLRTFDSQVWDFYLDCKFALALLKALPETDVARAHLLRGLNDAANSFDPNKRESLAAAKKLLREASAAKRVDRYHTLTPLGHAHLDTAWLWPLDITVKKMAHTASIQLALMEEYENYVFVHSQAAQYEWLENRYPRLFERIKDKVANHQWEPVGSMWVECDTNVPNGESLVRQFLYGKRYFAQKFDLDTKDMWLPDCFGYSAALPQILRSSGVDSFFTQKISWNQFNKFPHNTFWWQGIDGSRVWSHFPPSDTYTGSSDPAQLLRHLFDNKDSARCDYGLYVYGHGDGGGGPTPEHIEMLLRASRAPGLPQIEWRRAAEFFEEARTKSRDLAVWVGELYFELHRGTLTSQANNKRMNRVCEFLMRDAEWLACFDPKFPTHYPAKECEALWKKLLLNQFHDILPGSSVREVYEESDRDYADISERANKLIAASLERQGQLCDTSKHQRAVALFSSADIAAETRIPAQRGTAPQSIECEGEVGPVQAISEFGDKLWIFKTPEAAIGRVAVADLRKEEPGGKPRLKVSQRRLENDLWGVQFDSHGNLTSVVSLEDETEYIEPGKLGNLFQLFEDKPTFWSAWDVEAYALETGTDLVRSERVEVVERGPVRIAVEVEKRFGGSRIVQRISLGPTPGVRFDTLVDWRQNEKLLKVAFPVNVNSSRATYEIQFGNLERPTHRNTAWDLAKFEVCGHKWIDLSEGDQGVALLNDSKYGHDVLGNLMRITLLRAPKAPDPECDMGVHRFTYVMLPHYGAYNWAGVVQAGYAINAPTRYRVIGRSPGPGLQDGPFVSCNDRNIVIEAVKKAEDSKSIICRLYECHNARGRAEIRLARPIRRAALCDLMENEVGELDVRDGCAEFDYTPFVILTVKFELG